MENLLLVSTLVMGKKGFFKISYKESVYFPIDKLNSLKKFFENAKAKIMELGGSFK